MSNLESYSLADYNREISNLMTILKKEIKLLRAGNYANIERSSRIKAARIKSLAALMATLDDQDRREFDRKSYRQLLGPRMAQLKSLSIENGRLLHSVLSGVKSAGQRIQALKTQATNVGVYGRQGAALSFDEQPNSAEKTF